MSNANVAIKAALAEKEALYRKYFPEGFKDGGRCLDDFPGIKARRGAEAMKVTDEDYLRLLEEVLSVCAAVRSANFAAETGGREPLSLDIYRNGKDHDDFIVKMDFALGGTTVRAEYSSQDSRLVVTASWYPDEIQGTVYCNDGIAFDFFNEM